LVEKRILERRNRAHVDAAENEHTALLEEAQRGGNQLAGRREDDRSIEPFRRSIGDAAGPYGAETAREISVLRLARHRVDLRSPVPRDLDRDVRGGAESVEPEPAALADRRESERA